MKIEKININDIKEYKNNAKEHPDWQIEGLSETIKKIGYRSPIIIDENNMILAGHGRYLALKKLGYENVQVIKHTDLTEKDKKAYMIADNQYTLNTGFNIEILKQEIEELENLDFDISLLGFDEIELQDITKNEIEETTGDNGSGEVVEGNSEEIEEPENIVIKTGDLIKLGNHRVMCGDSTNSDDVKKLMENKKAHLVFTDPPYGMKKEKDGVANDNLSYDDLLEFNKKWIPLSFENLKENGSWYCWGIDEPLMDIYSSILKPKIKNNEITFRNLITWNKGVGQGQNSELTRMYATADEKCLFVMNGVQGFNTNSDNYYEGFEPLRKYLNEEMEKCGGTKAWRKALGNQMGKHYFTKSQWTFPTEENYKKLQAYGKERGAFEKYYRAFQKEYEKIKEEFYNSRAYFNNTHDNMNNVWHFNRLVHGTKEKEEAGGHATPKPIELCSRAIKSSSREEERVLDLFGGSGSTLIACEQLNRKAYLMELEPKWVQVIIERYLRFTGEEEVKINRKTVNWEEYKNG